MADDAFLTDELRAVRAVILELMEVLSEYREHLVLTGGVVPHLLLPPDESGVYRSTNDVDVVLDLAFLHTLEDDSQETIHEILMQNLYQQDEQKRFRWHKGVCFGGPVYKIPVDLLAKKHYSPEEREIHRRVEMTHDIYPSPLLGVDIALLSSVTIPLSGKLPDGRERQNIPVRVVDLALFPLIKAIAFVDRLKAREKEPDGNHEDQAAKHGFDIYECLSRFPGGLTKLAEGITPHLNNPLVQEALECLYTAFVSPQADGPRLLIREEKYAIEPDDVTDFVRQDAFQRVQFLRVALPAAQE